MQCVTGACTALSTTESGTDMSSLSTRTPKTCRTYEDRDSQCLTRVCGCFPSSQRTTKLRRAPRLLSQHHRDEIRIIYGHASKSTGTIGPPSSVSLYLACVSNTDLGSALAFATQLCLTSAFVQPANIEHSSSNMLALSEMVQELCCHSEARGGVCESAVSTKRLQFRPTNSEQSSWKLIDFIRDAISYTASVVYIHGCILNLGPTLTHGQAIKANAVFLGVLASRPVGDRNTLLYDAIHDPIIKARASKPRLPFRKDELDPAIYVNHLATVFLPHFHIFVRFAWAQRVQ